jgi:hypothetical protein
MNIYLGLFLIAFSGLSLEIALVRLLSVTTWYHLAFFAISTAMLGMTAGATRVFLNPKAFTKDNLERSLWISCIHYSLSIPVTLLLLCLIPLSLFKSAMSIFALVITTFACALPYYFAGTVVSAVLTKCNLPMGRLYASDLIGASMGCIFVLGGLELIDAPSLILLCGCIGAISAVCFGWSKSLRRNSRIDVALVAVFLLAGIANSLSSMGIRPVVVKGQNIETPEDYRVERWNSFSRVVVYEDDESNLRSPQYWGPSPFAPMDRISQYRMNIDGDAATYIRKFGSKQDIDHLRYDVTNIAYYVSRRGPVAIIGVGGGRDVQCALLFGQEHVVGIEINPIFIDLLKNEFRTFAGIADRSDVTLVTAEARDYLSRKPEKYSLIQMSLIDTWAATGAGAFSLSENSLYTVEAWHIFLERLRDNGIFTVSRWHSPEHIGETGRVVSLAVTTLLDHGVETPSGHIALITAGKISTLLMSRQPFSREDVYKLANVCDEMGFAIILMPGRSSADRLLGSMVSSRSRSELSAVIAEADFNYSPPSNETPYFFNMLRLSKIGVALKETNVGVARGNLIATFTLLGLLGTLFIVAIATVIFPLMFRKRRVIDIPVRKQTLWAGAVYFSLIGAGFMLTEIALVQRLTVLLSHPMYALGILLFSLIASTGVGSLLSDKLPLTRKPWAYIYPIITAGCLVGLKYLLREILVSMIGSTVLMKIIVSIAMIFPMGILMGLFFPVGMRLAKSVSADETPWYWALNGIFGVLCSALAVFISIYIGVSMNFNIAAVCYGAVIIAQIGLQKANMARFGLDQTKARE